MKSFNEFFFAEKSSGFADIFDVPAQPVVSRNYYYYFKTCILYKYKMSIDLDDKLVYISRIVTLRYFNVVTPAFSRPSQIILAIKTPKKASNLAQKKVSYRSERS